LTAALAYHFEQLSSAGGPTRPGIVHRLDRDTSGVIVVAKSDPVHLALAKQFEERTVEKEYFAIAAGTPDRDADTIEQPIGVHPYQREKMAIRAGHATSRDARTFYQVLERLGRFSAFKVLPKTGRTHQIRVHLAHIGCPVLCDPLYSGRNSISHGDVIGDRSDNTVLLDRTALHARRLTLCHPRDGKELTFEAPLPTDLTVVLDVLRRTFCGAQR
jgi:23S rRNA pseudouridine1911/1915/1917 synthase